MNLDDVVAELLAGPLEEFTNRRNARAKELKAAGQRELAAEVATLKKPPVAVWAVNQLARRDKAVLERVRHAGEGVVRAQSGAVTGRKNAAVELRAASEALQRELEAALREAGDVLRGDEHAADEATLRRVQEMLRLAAVDRGETWDRLQRGALISEPRAGEDMLTAAFALGAAADGGGAAATRPKPGASKASEARASDAKAARAMAREAAETEKRIEMEHVLRTAKADEEAAQQTAQTAHRLREEADRIAADGKRANERARQAEKELERATARSKASREAARRISRRG
jgi:hypothetical protein